MHPSIYNLNYYTTDCEGFEQFANSRGGVLSQRLRKILARAEIKPGMWVLDLGCGRGELVLHSALLKANAVGLDFSSDAVKLARENLKHWTKKRGEINVLASILQADCARLPFKKEVFDLIILSDIIEHLTEEALLQTLCLLQEVLKPGGKIILHTSPNRIFLDYGLKIYAFLGLFFGRWIGWSPKTRLPAGLGKEYHVREHTVWSLKKLCLKAGFENTEFWLEKNPHYVHYFFGKDRLIRYLNHLYRLIPIQHLFFSEIYGMVSKEATKG